MKTVQAQPKKVKAKGHEEMKYREKLISKANMISASATRLWGELLPSMMYNVAYI